MKKDFISNVPLHLFRIVQTLWALALLAFVTPLLVRAASDRIVAVPYIVAIVLYAIATCAIFMDYRWSWILSVAFLAGYWLLHGWMALANFVVNTWMFLSGHELYKNSPMTIFIVFISAIFGVFPATCLLILGTLARRQIFSMLWGASTGGSAHCPVTETEEGPRVL
ncbi:MAG: hypothetical protein RBS72_11835 [Sedimentisphaerales bacterium]|jgi:hypothetical protein|nr:hypothetical protein [Sedimentisphaerales bacterium]HNY80518.1 hypothetical protein [Sedimentisphaerales bacterium]HOC63708.1 hypothetical protein [Sedimentisphaerales bacterium]HOH66285.1 hypothetical protein [Sedimentisphaerales bacterium]HPY48889.1 hypothetical protein [Sedimentisphaerales bacterium]